MKAGSVSDEIGRNLDAVVARRKAEMGRRMGRVALKVCEWANADGGGGGSGARAETGVGAGGARARVSTTGESIADAARAGRWGGLWAVMESHKAEILRILARRG